ncbi:MAG: HD domain-containing phosphohydrolase [Thermodesulfobacteriota bacterium]|jgi:HD-GYP domain-containing protein (c-di-GMP phosphodiesterase class II)
MPIKKIDLNRWLDKLKRIEDKAERLALLSHLSQILNSTLDHKEIRRRAMEAATRLMKAEVGSLLLVNEEKRQLYFEVALGDREEDIKTIPLNFGEGIAGWVAQHGKPLIVNSPEKDPRFFKGVDERTEFKTRNIICVPVKVKEKIIGVLEAINKRKKGRFNKEDLSLLTSLADQVAIALDNSRLYQELEDMFFQTAESLADAIEKRDPYTGGHTQRVTLYSQAIAKFLQLKPLERKWLKIASVLHDIGKIGIEDHILKKPERLSPEEFNMIKRHSDMGAEIIEHIRQLRESIPGVKYHHEQVNGKGYPDGLRGEEIPILAKIVAVADTYDAMTTDRPYRKATEKEVAIEELRRCSGTQLDKEVVEAFIQAYQRGEI